MCHYCHVLKNNPSAPQHMSTNCRDPKNSHSRFFRCGEPSNPVAAFFSGPMAASSPIPSSGPIPASGPIPPSGPIPSSVPIAPSGPIPPTINETKPIQIPKQPQNINHNDSDEGLCVVCLENKKDYKVSGCNHVVSCEDCKDGIFNSRKCPMCRNSITKPLKKIFL